MLVKREIATLKIAENDSLICLRDKG